MEKTKKLLLRIASALLIVIGLSLPIIGGNFSDDFYIENSANYLTTVVKTKTKGHYLSAFSVKSATGGGLPKADIEFHNLYGVFRQNNITFSCVINAQKEHDVFLDNISDNLSLFYYGPMGTNPLNDHYRHYIYPLEYMFEDSQYSYSILKSKYVITISKKHADKILEFKGVLKDNENSSYSKVDYQSLINSVINLKIDGVEYPFAISNILLPNEYYYQGINEIVNDFACVSYYYPQTLKGSESNLYYMNEYQYQNEYFMNYICSTYNKTNYELTLCEGNLTSTINLQKATSFFYNSKVNNGSIFILCCILCGLLLVGSLVIIFVFKIQDNIAFLMSLSILSFLPYCIFKIISKYYYFSITGFKISLVSLVCFLILSISILIIISAIKKRKKTIKL